MSNIRYIWFVDSLEDFVSSRAAWHSQDNFHGLISAASQEEGKAHEYSIG